jgi:predicted Zn-dependent protease
VQLCSFSLCSFYSFSFSRLKTCGTNRSNGYHLKVIIKNKRENAPSASSSSPRLKRAAAAVVAEGFSLKIIEDFLSQIANKRKKKKQKAPTTTKNHLSQIVLSWNQLWLVVVIY